MKVPNFLRTFPWWHNYTGLSKKPKGFDVHGVTWLDEISRQHDKACQSGSATFLGAFKSKSLSWNNIKADGMFIIRFIFTLTYAFFGNCEKADTSNIVMFFVKAIGNTVMDVIVGGFGCILFLINIILNGANILFRSISRKS